MSQQVIYLTGASGFIGQKIVQLAEEDDKITKIYCPIRSKYNLNGRERFDELFGNLKKATYVNSDEEVELPHDTTHIILNAFSVRFNTPVVDIWKQNVIPMLKILEQCRNRNNSDDKTKKIEGVSIVSTAYVQLPLPYERDPMNRIEFALRHKFSSASEVMDGIMSGSLSEETIDSHLNEDHYKNNNYVFCKHLMEHVIHEKFSDLPVCIVRPSIVSPSRDGLHGHGVKNGFSLFMEIAKKPVMRFPRNEGKLDITYVEDVSLDIIKGATSHAGKAVPKADSGTLFHPIISSTSRSDAGILDCFKMGAPDVRRFDVRNETLRNMLRSVEKGTIRVFAGKKAAVLVDRIYENFDPIMKNRWDYEKTNPWSNPQDMVDRYYQRQEELSNKKDSSNSSTSNDKKARHNWLQADTFVAFLLAVFSLSPILEDFPLLRFVCAFMLLRFSVLMGMQSLFYGDTTVRENFPYTINSKSHDSRQHDREETSWPSILVSGIEFLIVYQLGLLPDPTTMPFYTPTSLGLVVATHMLPVEFIYYWAHRLMHEFPSVYKVHKHHHLSIVPSPKTSVTFLWSEHFFYDMLFALPVLVPAYFGHATVVSTLLYVPTMDFLNTLGHTNLEVFPSWWMDSPFYYFLYCTTYHNVHHRYFKYNYALFMPIYDMLFGTYSEKFTKTDFNAAKTKQKSV